MGKSARKQQSREKMRAAAKQPKQTTLDNIPKVTNTAPAKPVEDGQKKQITITEIAAVSKEDELTLRIGFKLSPSRETFSKITSDLYFNGQKIGSTRLTLLQGPLATDNSEFMSVLDMKGISAGPHTIKVEMYELWATNEKLTQASKELVIEYVPIKREDRLIEVPIVKGVAGTGLVVVSESEKEIYREIEENVKKEIISKRDKW